ncbi:sirohydrochlorin chelatase [Rhodococcus rhodnii]|uniref:Ferrochelatase n=1 Tax=Rhodococcus rhodnii LMG 5362 TaxID=1273125 RepID=R7WM59_9NOCA|nr:sirohydrochlorin chelatase [Rhodococcus rhodnii]EOM76392.1 hypothetical protein Rrhod_2185 [Rhodococcus rhodnii LMG 5362]
MFATSAPPLVAVAHGSRDPRSAAVIGEAVANLRAASPDLDVRAAFLDLSAPRIDHVLTTLAREGHHEVVVAPMLLGRAFHARVDLPGIIAAVRSRHPRLTVHTADVLGPDPRLIAAVRDRVTDIGVAAGDPDVGVALVAVGSSDAAANDVTSRIVGTLRAGAGWHSATACFATAASPSVSDAIASLRERGARDVVVAPWFLAPGLLIDRVHDAAAAGRARVAPTIGAHPALTEVVLDRYRAALERARHTRAAG